MKGRALFPAVCLKNAECVVNFGGAPWAYPPPPGPTRVRHDVWTEIAST